MPVYVCGVAVAEGLAGGASQIAMVEDHRAVAGTKKENFLKSISNNCHEMLSVISSRINIESALYVILHFLVFFSRNPPPVRTENRLIVENLSSRVSWQVIIALYFLYIYT